MGPSELTQLGLNRAASKKCTRCRRVQPLSEFHKNHAAKDGLMARCKGCRHGYKLEPIPDGHRQCRRCDEILPDYRFYESTTATRLTCINCCEARWKKSYKKTTTRIANGKLTLFGCEVMRSLSTRGHEARLVADRKYKTSQRGKDKREEWLARNPGIQSYYDNVRRARKANLASDLTQNEWARTIKAFDSKCVYCDGECNPINLDHWVPIARNGPTIIGNVVPACKSCNSHKRSKMPSDFCEPIRRFRIESILEKLKQGIL